MRLNMPACAHRHAQLADAFDAATAGATPEIANRLAHSLDATPPLAGYRLDGALVPRGSPRTLPTTS